MAGFGTGGFLQLAELADPAIIPQLAQRGAGAAHRIFVTYGLQGAPPAHIRYLVLNGTGAAVTGPMDLPDAVGGTARHGWFHLATTETPVRSIAAWHRLPVAGPPITVFLNRFNVAGAKQHAAPIQLTLLPGESRNAVIAPRPVQFRPAFPTPAAAATASLQREYGAAWQNQPVGGRWEIRFSRLNRDGTVHAVTRDVAVVQRPAAQATDPQLVWHSDGYGLAWLEQPVAGGDHTLFFTVLGEAGLRVDLAPLGAPAALVGDFQVNEAGGDVQDFRLVWTGRSFRIVWSEVRGGRMRHLQRSLIVPRQQGMVNAYDQPFQHPSSALVRATLINGATNLRNLALPAVGNLHDGYGWGRLNLRQSLAPAAPAVYQARDDASVAAGQTARYEFSVPPGAQLLRVALVWTDPPGNRIVNNLNLRVTVPAGGALPVRVFVGNRWQAGAPQLSDPLPAVPPPSPFNDVHPIETIVVQGAPTLPSGVYRVDVLGGGFTNNSFQQFPGQPFALVFVASGPEFRFPAGGALPAALPVY